MTLLTSTALAILGGIFAALLAFGGVRAAWRGFAGRRGTFAALCVLAAFCAILADKPTPVPSALLRWDRGLADNGSVATNDTVSIRGTYDPLMANDALHVDYRPKWITDSPDGWTRAYDGGVSDLADGFAVTIPDATNMVIYIWSEYVEPAPTHTNGEYRIIYVGRIDGGAAESPRYVLPRTPIVASSEIVPIEYLESTGTQYVLLNEFINGFEGLLLPANNNNYGAVGNWNGGSRANTIKWAIKQNRGWIVTDESNTKPVYSGNLKQDLLYVSVRGIDVTIDGVPYTLGNSWGLHSQFLLFGCVSYGSSSSAAGTVNLQSCKIGPCKLYQDNTLVHDFQPVRIGTTGALYDRRGVGGMNPDGTARNDGLYFNRGTGAFILGSDVRNGSAILSPPSLPPPAQSLFSTLATENLTE